VLQRSTPSVFSKDTPDEVWSKKCDMHGVNFLRRIADALFGSTYNHDLPLMTTRTAFTGMDMVLRENRGFNTTTDLNNRKSICMRHPRSTCKSLSLKTWQLLREMQRLEKTVQPKNDSGITIHQY